MNSKHKEDIKVIKEYIEDYYPIICAEFISIAMIILGIIIISIDYKIINIVAPVVCLIYLLSFFVFNMFLHNIFFIARRYRNTGFYGLGLTYLISNFSIAILSTIILVYYTNQYQYIVLGMLYIFITIMIFFVFQY